MNNIETRANSAAGKGGRQFPAWLVMVLLVLVTVALYWPATSHDFADYDDNFYVTENSHVQGGLTWAGVKWAFLNPVAGNWHPLTVLSHMLDCQLFGLNPWGHHLTSVLLHAVNTVLVFLLLATDGLRPESAGAAATGGAIWRSVMVAALFGWHPVHVESVAWVAERKDVLSTFFGLLALIAYARYVREDRQSKVHSPKSATVLALLFFALGLMSKAMLVTWPFVMLLLDWWPLQRVSSFKFSVSSSGTALPSTLNPLARRSEAKTAQLSTLVFEKLPFFGLAAVTSVVTFAVQKQSGAVRAVENLPLNARAENALISYCRYLGKLFWPVDLAVFYPYPRHWPMGEVLLAGGLFWDNGAVHRGTAALSIYADGLVVVCGDTGAGDWVGASERSSDGGSVHLYSVTWGVDSGNLGCVRIDPSVAEPGDDIVGGGCVRQSSCVLG